MIHEFALEPEVLATPENIRYFLEQFDVHKGRLIADYPKRWVNEVFRVCAPSLSPVQRKAYEERLFSLQSKVLERASKRTYDGNGSKDWLQNAEIVQDRNQEPFRAIVASENPRSHGAVLVADDVNEDIPLWKVARQIKIDRKASSLTEVVAPLLLISKEILLVDPYFDPCNPAYRSSLRAMLEPIVRKRATPTRIELHCCVHPRSSLRFWDDCADDLPAIIPQGLLLTIVRWKTKEGGERFHRRYVLTERGGIYIEGGLDKGPEGQTTDVYLLEADLRTERWTDYQPESTVFDPDPNGPLEVIGTRR